MDYSIKEYKVFIFISFYLFSRGRRRSAYRYLNSFLSL